MSSFHLKLVVLPLSSLLLLIVQPRTNEALPARRSAMTYYYDSRSLLNTDRLIARNAPPLPRTQPSSGTVGFNVEYAILTANTPDCEQSLADDFPVVVQYRMTSPSTNDGEWTTSTFAQTQLLG